MRACAAELGGLGYPAIGPDRYAPMGTNEEGSMAHTDSQDHGGTALRSWLVVLGIALAFLTWGLIVYYAVGDKGSPGWDFGVIQDIPGQSPYSTHQTKRLPNLAPLPESAAKGVAPQHVMGLPAEPGITRQEGGR
jgi:hypothetical protein